MRLPASTYAERHWQIQQIAPEFDVEDVWALPTPGGESDFPRLVDLVTAFDPSAAGNAVVRGLFGVRAWIGTVLGWDEGASESTQTLATRIPTELRGTARPPVSATFPFLPLYETPTEWAAELSNRTVHGVVHLGWVAEDDHYRGELSILVKPNGRLGSAYLLAIKPFRYAAVYPAILRELGRRWDAEVVR